MLFVFARNVLFRTKAQRVATSFLFAFKYNFYMDFPEAAVNNLSRTYFSRSSNDDQMGLGRFLVCIHNHNPASDSVRLPRMQRLF